MNNEPRDCSTEDEGVDEDMMFEFEEELSTRLSLHERDRAAARSSIASRPRSPFPASYAATSFMAAATTATSTPPMAVRPQNPVASVLLRASDDDTSFASLSTSPFSEYSSPAAMASLRVDGATGSVSAPPAMPLDKSPSFDFNGRRKRKYFDDSCCVTPRVRPLAKRAKSFSCVGDAVLLPDCGFKSICSTSFVPCVAEPKRLSPVPSSSSLAALSHGPVFSSSRSKSIQIPHRDRPSAAHRSAVVHLQRSSSGPARGTSGFGFLSKPLDVPAASSDPLTTQASSSWNASVEYFCRRSLDISSPLRTRFRDLVVSSVGRAGSLKSP